MEQSLMERSQILSELLDVPEINFGIDHDWCRFDPFYLEYEGGKTVSVKLVITNHFNQEQCFHVRPEFDETFPLRCTKDCPDTVTIAAGEEGTLTWTLEFNESPETFPTRSQMLDMGAKVFTPDGTLNGRCLVILAL